MITGGSEAALTHIGLSAFAAMRALSERNDDPTRASRPFDRDRDGFVLSEGAGLLVLEELEHAKARGARIYGEMLGYGVQLRRRPHHRPGQGRHRRRLRHGAGHQGRPDQSRATSTTSTPTAPARRWAIRPKRRPSRAVFKDHAYKVSISSTKSQLGHLLGASGGVELILCLLALRDGVIPPTINLRHARSGVRSRLHAQPGPAARRSRVAMSNSFGFGGHNGSLVVGKLRNG